MLFLLSLHPPSLALDNCVFIKDLYYSFKNVPHFFSCKTFPQKLGRQLSWTTACHTDPGLSAFSLSRQLSFYLAH